MNVSIVKLKKGEENENEETLNIYTLNNNIYFYEDIDANSSLFL